MSATLIDMVRSGLRSRWTKALQAAVTLLLIAWILSSIDRQVWASLTQISWGTLVISVLLFSSAQVFGGLRLAILIPGTFPWREALAATWAGYFWANFLPGSIGGDFVRVFALSKSGMALPGAAGALLLDRLLNLAAIGAVLALSALPLSYRITDAIDWMSILLVFGFVIGLLGALLLFSGSRFRKLLSQGFEPFLVFAQSPHRFFAAICLSFINIGVSIVAQWFIATNLGLSIGFMDLAGIICLVTVLVMLPISINGLGLQEASFVTFLIATGAPEEKALAFSLLVRFLIFGASGIAGIVILTRYLRGASK